MGTVTRMTEAQTALTRKLAAAGEGSIEIARQVSAIGPVRLPSTIRGLNAYKLGRQEYLVRPAVEVEVPIVTGLAGELGIAKVRRLVPIFSVYAERIGYAAVSLPRVSILEQAV